MKILGCNVNGIRAAYKKGFLKWLEDSRADIVCLQETRATREQLPDDLLDIKGYYLYLNPALKKGYSGTAIYAKQKPIKIDCKMGTKRFDQEGRFIKLEYSDFDLINIYFPHGGREKNNLQYKLETYKRFLNYLKINKSKNIILVGDFNVAHKEIDLARPKQNHKNIMFTSEERAQIDEIIQAGFVDTFREFHKKSGHYTWWPYSFNAKERNLGWRIDYIFTSKKMALKLKRAFILNKVNISDHCPIGIEI